MAMNFPDSPSVDDTFTVGDQTWKWTGTTWDTVPLTEYSPSPHAATHELGGSDPLELDPTQVTGLDELNTGTAGYTALSNGTAGLSYQPVSHNYIINGAFDIWQRGETFTGISNDEFLADRWKQRNIDNASQSTDTPNDFIYSAELDFTGAFARLDQYIESSNCSGLVNKEITTSFWIKANQATIDLNEIRVAAFEADAKDDWSSETLTFINEIDISGLTADTWTRVSTTTNVNLFSSAAMNGIHLQIFFSRSNSPATEGTVKITGVQLEAGSIATPFKRNANSIQGELAACQRYYFRDEGGILTRFINLSSGTRNIFGDFSLPTTMRPTPSVTVTIDKGAGQVNADFVSVTNNYVAVRADSIPAGDAVDIEIIEAENEL